MFRATTVCSMADVLTLMVLKCYSYLSTVLDHQQSEVQCRCDGLMETYMVQSSEVSMTRHQLRYCSLASCVFHYSAVMNFRLQLDHMLVCCQNSSLKVQVITGLPKRDSPSGT